MAMSAFHAFAQGARSRGRFILEDSKTGPRGSTRDGSRLVTAVLRPPLVSFGFLSPSLAPKEEKRKVPELIIYLAYNLAAYSGADAHGLTRVSTGLSGREYKLWQLERNNQTVQSSAMLLGLPAPTLQTAGVACAAAQAL